MLEAKEHSAMHKKYIVTLTAAEREQLEQLTSAGKGPVRRIKHAYILLKANRTDGASGWSDEQISVAYDVHCNTVAEVRKRFVLEGFDSALQRKPAGHRPRALDGEAEAHLIALACSEAPADHAHWTLRLLAQRMVELKQVEQLSHETVRQTLKKMNLSLG
jgi:transposase